MAKRKKPGSEQRQESFIISPVVFVIYLSAAFIVICGYTFIFSAQREPLPSYRVSWRLINSVIAFIHLFPALAFSALVIPFGLKEHSAGGYAGTTYVGKKSFSVLFLKYITPPVITACVSSALYALLFFLALPLTLNARASMEDRGELYTQALEKAKASIARREWSEAAQFIGICEQIWRGSEEVDKLKSGVTDSLASPHQSLTGERRSAAGVDAETPPGGELPVWQGIPGDPVNSTDALRLAEEAFNQERYYDAHWLATLAQRLARPGAAEISAALALASRAWDKIAALEPSAQEQERFSLYRLKREGYEAMNAGDWISAFYTFQELAVLSPEDPDAANYLERSRNGLSSTAFFIDELDLAIGNILTGAVFSLPEFHIAAPEFPAPGSSGDGAGGGQNGGRVALRFSSLAALPDFAYAWGPEMVAADGAGNFLYRVSANYAKLLPVPVWDDGGGPDRVVMLFQALDRTDKTRRWDPVWVTGEDTGLSQNPGSSAGASQIMLDVSYDHFLLLSKLKRGTGALTLRDLFTAEKQFGAYGYISESFQAEILRRLADPVFFLPITIIVLILGWRYRARKKPRYVYVPMLGILPLVFYGILLFYRGIMNNLSIWLCLSFGFSTAMICFIAGAALCFIASLVTLALQHG
ncbi:MAG: hypothetical protein LBG84_03515 [Treponema sp.]|jgi:hypothetical protein|nr:hypothetical protein [Treponema sp.]